MDMKVLIVLALLLVGSVLTDTCSDNCKCTKYKIFCKDSTIMALPKGCSSMTLLLSMEADVLEQLTTEVFNTSSLMNLQTLKLINMNIRWIQTSAFHTMRKLESLTITKNHLNDIEAGTFKGLDLLHTLDLSENKIINLNSGVFEGLGGLRHLILRSNFISHIHFHMFDGLRREGKCQMKNSRSILDLSENQIEIADEGVFQDISFFKELKIRFISWDNDFSLSFDFKSLCSLRQITMDTKLSYGETKIKMQGLYNIIDFQIINFNFQKIHNRYFEDSHLLKKLKIVQSNVQELETHCFQGLKSLSELDLSLNKLKHLNNSVFQHLGSLVRLNLSFNNLITIQENVFKGLNRLKFLELRNNQLTSLNRYAFCCLPLLRELQLNNVENIKEYSVNKIINIHSESVSGLFSLKTLQLPYSPQNSSKDVELFSMHRLDSFQGPGYFMVKGIEVMKMLNFIESGAFIENHIEKWLTEVKYLKEPISLEIHYLNELSKLKTFNAFYIPTLHLRYSNISITENNSFYGFSELKSLSIESDSVITIQQGALVNLQNLQSMEMHSKKGFQLQPGAFEKLNNLNRLVLTRDHRSNEYGLTDIRDFLKGLKNLKELRLSFNYIQSVGIGNFLELENLEILDLSHNSISHLNEGTFQGLRHINNLKLNDNKIPNVSPGVFGAVCTENLTFICVNLTRLSEFCNCSFVLHTLTHLDLEWNSISFIHQHAFLGCNKLQLLRLSLNHIKNLDFLYTPQLTYLYLEMNSVAVEISESTFSCNSMLSDITFRSTYVKYLHLSAIENLQLLKNIYLPNTTCDCKLKEIFHWLHSNDVQYTYPYICNHHELVEIFISKLKCNLTSKYTNPRNKTSTADRLVYFKNYIEPIVLILIFLSGSFGNGLLLFIIFRHSDMRNKNNACVVHLAISDILSLIINLPLSYWDVNQIYWDLGETTCKIFITSKDLVIALVVFSVLALTFERFLVVRTSYNLKSPFTARPTLFLGIVWFYALATSIPSYFNASVHGRCFVSLPGRKDYIRRVWTFQLLLYCFLPVVSIVFLNILSAYTLKKSIRNMPGNIRNQSREKSRNTVINIVAILSFVFTLSYLPNFLLRTLVSWSVWNFEEIFWYSFVTYCLFFFHTIFNPFAVFVMSSKYKSHIKEYMKIFIQEKKEIKKPPDTKKAFLTPGHMLYNLGKGFAVTQRDNEILDPVLPNDIEARDEAARQARQERLKKLQARFR